MRMGVLGSAMRPGSSRLVPLRWGAAPPAPTILLPETVSSPQGVGTHASGWMRPPNLPDTLSTGFYVTRF